ncbi:MAG: creatininase family protein [Anaerolineae bacterium]|nr:creatininase family protein [Anaerolineae bacterium]
MIDYGERAWPHIPGITERVAVVPLGSLEQHGPHLPLLTDTLILEAIVERAAAQLEDVAVFLPALWAGASDHHLGFPGTVSLSHETYRRVLVDVVESLIGSGFRRIVLLNAHGGNSLPGRAATYEVQMRHRDERDLWLVFATWFELAAPQIAAVPGLDQDHVTHACELETSLILHLRPELVDLSVARGADVSFGSRFYCPDSSRRSRVGVVRPFDHVSIDGAYGHPERGSAEKGQVLIDAVVQEVVGCIREIAGWATLQPA